MEKIKKRLSVLPILTMFLLLTITFLLIAMFVIEVERTMLHNAQYSIAFQYSDIVEGFNAVKVWGDHMTFALSSKDSQFMQFYEMLLWLLPPATYFVCIFTAGIVFYRIKIKVPLALLSSAAQRIADRDLDFSIHYEKQDEMGKLCSAFEKMRFALETNNRMLWRQIDDRKRLNRAFSHDLRTPLTVLEGHLGILQKYGPAGRLTEQDISDIYAAMAGQIDRLKIYVSSMSDLQRLEDIEIVRHTLSVTDFIAQLKDTAAMLCNSKRLTFSSEITASTVFICPEIVIQVFENLLSNAVRYAEHTISVVCCVSNNCFSINVSDDGPGFRDVALKSATDPFYTTEQKNSGQHFGLGLNICKILCEQHGGEIILSNQPTGGADITVSFGMDG